MSKLIAFLFLFVPLLTFAQPKLGELSVEKIMRDPQWIGTSPSSPFWGADGTTLYFSWNPDKAASDSLYYITVSNRTPIKATVAQKEDILAARSLVYNTAKNALTYPKGGDIFYTDLKSKTTRQITKTVSGEYNPVFSFNDKSVVYMSGKDLFAWEIATGETMQLTNVQDEGESKSRNKLSEQEEWLKNDQMQYMEILKERSAKEKLRKEYNDRLPKNELKKIIVGSKRVMGLNISPDGHYIGYALYTAPTPSKRTIIPNYVTESGFTTDIPGRPKVGEAQGTVDFFVYDRANDTILSIKMDDLEGIRDLPDYLQDYPKELQKRKKENSVRPVSMRGSNWSPNGSHLVLDLYSEDSKDRWLVLVNPKTGKIKLLDRQRNEAWVGGPGLRNKGWLDENNFWYQSEASGYSHLYSVNVESGSKKQYTSGKYEVQDAQLSNDKKYFYISTNEVHPGEKQFYRLRIADSKQERVTTQTGSNDVTLSPDEKTVAILYSYSNKPWELYLQPNQAGSKAEQITNKAQSDEFKSYAWRDPEVITFDARDGAKVYGRIYKPANAKPGMPAVVFVHGAGYLQNAHKWWSSYFREYMFHNLLADRGFYVIDIDYRGSAGYGADWRTGIYRHMGGKDLTDNVDAANYLVKNYGVDPKGIGLYGGSYGGFITLMAMFTTPDVFAAGAGLRSVTDWANYNHGYTSNILNEPFNDSLAYRKSSPIYYAEGLKGHLLMCHGMVDVNVHFQDIVKVTQRLIELKKENWELAVYPMEDHGFVEPTSWMDEYKRILKLFETVLKKH